MTPDEHRPIGPTSTATRRVVRLAGVPAPGVEPPPAPVATPEPVAAPPRDRWLRVAERVVGDWAPTLREALVRVLGFVVVLVALAVTIGVGIAVLGAAVGLATFLVGRRRPEADR